MQISLLKFMLREIRMLNRRYYLLRPILGIICIWAVWGGLQIGLHHQSILKIILDVFFIISFTLCSGLFFHLLMSWRKGRFNLIRLYPGHKSKKPQKKDPGSHKSKKRGL